MKKILTTLLLALTMCGAHAQSSDRNIQSAKLLKTFAEIYRELELNFVDTLDTQQMFKESIDAMLYHLDPYTVYFTPKEAESFRESTSGKYAGIGSVISYHKGEKRCIISVPYEGMPAAKAGLRRGDVIMSINGGDLRTAPQEDVAHYNDSVSNCLRGEPGTQLRLSVKRKGEKHLLNFTLTRAIITVPSVLEPICTPEGIGYICITGFTENTARDVSDAVNKVKQQGAHSLILDLRGNSGGLLKEAVDLVNLFIPRGKEVVAMRGKNPEQNKVYTTNQTPLDENIPIVVLVDAQSASAAEITAGALQDYDRAVIMGQNTYGKGLVQTSVSLPGDAILKYTVGKYYIPSGRCVQAYKYEDGEPKTLPDSLAKTFYTQGGRAVRDCGGIHPDIPLAEDSLTNLLLYLSNSNLIDDYVALYHTKHKTIAPAKEFKLSDEEYQDFIAFLKQGGFTYDQQSAKALNALRKLAQFEGYGESSKAEFDALEAKLMHNEDYDYKYWEPQIRQIIEQAIVQDYYFHRGVNEYLLPKNKGIQQAIELLKNKEKYQNTLKK